MESPLDRIARSAAFECLEYLLRQRVIEVRRELDLALHEAKPDFAALSFLNRREQRHRSTCFGDDEALAFAYPVEQAGQLLLSVLDTYLLSHRVTQTIARAGS